MRTLEFKFNKNFEIFKKYCENTIFAVDKDVCLEMSPENLKEILNNEKTKKEYQKQTQNKYENQIRKLIIQNHQKYFRS